MRKPLACYVFILSLLLPACSDWPQPPTKISSTPSPTPAASPVTEVNITSPLEGGRITQTEMVKGTSRNIPNGQVIWVVVFIHKVGRYYPQNQPADVQSNGDWASVSYFGVAGDKDLKFDALAVLADNTGQKAFNKYLSDARDRNDYAGLERLPDGVKIYSRISVTRQ